MGMGETIGPYRVLRRLGVGGMAETFHAERTLSPTCTLEVCIKRLLPAYGEDADYLAMFRREASLASALRHPNVVAVVDVGDDRGQPYLVLELIDGIDLRGLLAAAPDHRLEPAIVTLLATELAHALSYAHAPEGDRPGLVHRDVSPSNVLLSRAGDVKLADFGIAKPLVGSAPTQSGAVRGKIPYLAPEQMRGEPVDGRADLFSLGVILYECLAGVRPFDGAHEVETMTRILADRRRPLRELAPEIEEGLAAIVDRLLAADPHERFADANELLDALDALDARTPPANARFALLDRIEALLGGPGERRHVRLARPAPETRETQDARTRRTRRPPTEPTRPAPAAPTDPDDPATVALAPSAARAADVAPAPRRRPRWLVSASASIVATGLVALGVGLGSLGLPTRTPSTPSAPPERPAANSAPAAATIASVPSPVDAPVVAATETLAAIRPPAPATPAQDSAAAAQPASAEPPAARRTGGRVRVVVLPWGRVWVDGVARGRAPAVLVLEAGSHRIAAGQEVPSVERRIRVEDGDTRTLELELNE